MKFWSFINKSEEEVELRISGDIIDDDYAWLYEWFGDSYASPNSFRDALAEHRGKNVTVWIDSYGGSCFAAAGIYNALKEHKGKVTVKIDGKAMSAASVIAMAGDRIEMSPVAMLMIHNPLTSVSGYASDMRQAAEVLDTVKESIVNAYILKTGRSREDISEMMDDETYMSANKAMREGFIDKIMYTDGDNSSSILDFNYAKINVLNSCNDAVKKILELKARKAGTDDPEPKEPEPVPAPENKEVISQQEKDNALKYLDMEEKIYE